jgi:hypothetical protein
MKKYISACLTAALVIVFIAGMMACVRKKDTVTINAGNRSVEQVFDTHRDSLLSIPGVVGAGIAKSDGKPCIVIMVKEKAQYTEGQIPKELDGYKVIVQETGELRALDGQ